MRASTPMTTMRMGPALRIEAGCYTEPSPDRRGPGRPGSPADRAIGDQASSVALIRSASARPMPGTAAICSTGASRTRLIDPKTLSSSRFRFGPTPGRSSNAERTVRLARRSRWYVIANRCASSRSRWTRYSAGDVGGRTIGSGRSGQEQLLALLGQAGERQVVQPELVEDLLGGAHLALAAVDDHEVRHRPAALLLAPLLARLRDAGTGGAAPPGGWRSRSAPGRSGSGTGGTPRSAACRPRTRPCCRPTRCPGSC